MQNKKSSEISEEISKLRKVSKRKSSNTNNHLMNSNEKNSCATSPKSSWLKIEKDIPIIIPINSSNQNLEKKRSKSCGGNLKSYYFFFNV